MSKTLIFANRLKLIPLIFGFFLVFTSCSDREKDKKIQGQAHYGGTLNLCEPQFVRNLYPLSINTVSASRLAFQIFDGLFKIDQSTLQISPNLIKKYTVDSSNLIYTFELKQGVYFHQDQCFKDSSDRLLTSEDVKFCFKNLLTPSLTNNVPLAYIDLFKNGALYYENITTDSTLDLTSFEIIDDYHFKIYLHKPYQDFPSLLATTSFLIYPREAYSYYHDSFPLKAVGSGPFYVAEVKEDNQLILKRNKEYHRQDSYGNKLPYLDAVNIQFILNKSTALNELKTGHLDALFEIPEDALLKIMQDKYNRSGDGFDKFTFLREAQYTTQYLGFNCQNPFLVQKPLRKAISFAINRKAILENTIKSTAFMEGRYGICPPVLTENLNSAKGYNYNLDSALHYFSQVTKPKENAEMILTLLAPSDPTGKNAIAVEMKQQIESALNVAIEIKYVPLYLLTTEIKKGVADMFLNQISAEYPNAFTILAPFYGGTEKQSKNKSTQFNFYNYSNSKFNALLDKAISTSNQAVEAAYYLEAQNILMEDAPIAVLWYSEGYQLIQPLIRNLELNPMQYHDLSKVYLDLPETLRDSNL